MGLKRSTRRSSAIVIRYPRQRDLPKITDLLSELSGGLIGVDVAADSLERIAASKEEMMVIACHDKEVVGLLAFRIRHNVESRSYWGEVSAIVVDPKWQKKGVGRKLLEEAETIARRKKCIGLWLVSGLGREEKAHKFYMHMGLACTGKRFVKLFK